ncbi:protein required for mother cell-specific HO expression [Scheffersomyces stipitis CBS 6054]|uniref:Protein required for mother cell-specific HO expression n=1 Tax=Scheffersomyces stipitis (strain ATCC 58785 / CBS 6054 / NBRC 10063 / NRRL Y-11545) TaxID=322104 RepID=A3LN82_PICST|nr:protein required for mother cell-specific HO expression [Scheffersomyces stipitis CBS 6054]ABN64285.2 protein required for mother cell-specific HO expression [Scheffersomyces stipitis CBS 6054]
MKELAQQVENLSITEDVSEEIVRLFSVRAGLSQPALDECNSTQLLQKAIKLSQKKEYSTRLYEAVLNDTETFLNGLQTIGDDQAVVLTNVLSNSSSEPKPPVVQNLLNSIKTIIKPLILDKDTVSKVRLFLSIYFSIVSHFGNESAQHLHVLLKFINPIPVILSESGESDYKTIVSLVMMILVKNLQANKKTTCEVITEYLELIKEDESPTAAEVLNYIELLENLYPLIPEVIEPIYTCDKSKNLITAEVDRVLESGGRELEYPNRRRVCISILNLISSSCISETGRNYNVSTFLQLLKAGTMLKDIEIKLLSTLNLIKLWNFIELEKKSESSENVTITNLETNLTSYLRNSNVAEDARNIEVCVEGLAYLSLNTSVKQHLRQDEVLIELLLKILKDSSSGAKKQRNDSSLVYGILVLISNLAKLKDPNDKGSDRSTASFLKGFATPSGSRTKDKEEDQDAIQLFNRSLLKDHKIIEIISVLKIYKEEDGTAPQIQQNNLLRQFIFILHTLSMNPQRAVKEEIVKQGGLNVILGYLIKYSTVSKATGETRPISSSAELIDTRMLAIRALAKILISVNPSLSFKKYDIKTSVPFLVELLGPDISVYTGSLDTQSANEKYLFDFTNLDKYESLMALTNLSSNEDTQLQGLILRRTYDTYLNNFIIDSDIPPVQKASWELISNLITQTSLLAKFFNLEDKDSYKRLDLLIKLLNSKDEELQIVIAGLLANATSEFDMISEILVKDTKIFKDITNTLSFIFQHQNSIDNLILRCSYVLINLVYAAANLGEEKLQEFADNQKLKSAVNETLKATKNQGILEVLIEVIKMVRFK